MNLTPTVCCRCGAALRYAPAELAWRPLDTDDEWTAATGRHYSCQEGGTCCPPATFDPGVEPCTECGGTVYLTLDSTGEIEQAMPGGAVLCEPCWQAALRLVDAIDGQEDQP